MTGTEERDPFSGTATTGHEWDGIKELNTPLPRWWVYIFVATVVWSVGYWIAYPAWPGLSGYTRGILGYSSRANFERQSQAAAVARQEWADRMIGQPIEAVAADADLLNYSIGGGRGLFATNCAPCHGAGGQGTTGFPVLADDDWIWGGDLASLEQTITHGIRNADPDSRQSEMPRFGADELLTPEEIADVTEYVLSLSGPAADAAAAERGQSIFADNCAACHGDDGKGGRDLGAPNLADAIWLRSGDRDAIIAQVGAPRHGVMPAWSGRLDEATIKMLAIYVHSLGGGE